MIDHAGQGQGLGLSFTICRQVANNDVPAKFRRVFAHQPCMHIFLPFPVPSSFFCQPVLGLAVWAILIWALGHGGAVSSVQVRDSPPPPPLRALRAHLVTKGRLLAIHRVDIHRVEASVVVE